MKVTATRESKIARYKAKKETEKKLKVSKELFVYIDSQKFSEIRRALESQNYNFCPKFYFSIMFH